MSFSQSQWLSVEERPVYHLPIKAENIANTIVIVGDPGRVKVVSRHFKRILHESSHREFTICTGLVGNDPLTVISSGIGVDNIDILLNELTHLLNTARPSRGNLRIIRLGTTGAVQENIAPGSVVVSKYAIGTEGLMHYYNVNYQREERLIARDFTKGVYLPIGTALPYCFKSSDWLDGIFPSQWKRGITLTANGFYGPQFREPAFGTLASKKSIEDVRDFSFESYCITNIEMECAGIYGLSRLFHHEAITLCTTIVNRSTGEMVENPDQAIKDLVDTSMEIIAQQLLKTSDYEAPEK